MQCDLCSNDATTGFQWPWDERGVVCNDHLTAVKLQSESLGQVPTYTDLRPRAALGDDPAALLSFVSGQLAERSSLADELARTLESERRSHFETREKLLLAETSAAYSDDLRARLATVQQAHHETHLQLLAMTETQAVNRALKERLREAMALFEDISHDNKGTDNRVESFLRSELNLRDQRVTAELERAELDVDAFDDDGKTTTVIE